MSITLKDFLKKYTAINEKFIDDYYKFYELCENTRFGIYVELVVKYLDISNVEKFYSQLRKKYIEDVDYIKEIIHNKKKEKGDKVVKYYITLDTFEKICMTSRAKNANNVRDYFIILRKFIQYYKNYISKMIINNTLDIPNGNVYIVLANKGKNIFKFGRSDDIRKRLKNYANGSDVHPDIKFIMLVEDKDFVENCVKNLIKNYRYKPRQEIYKIDIETIKNKIFDCGSLTLNNQDKLTNKNIDSYIIFDDSKVYNNNSKKKPTKKISKKKTNKK